jgi:hypothetical protein
MNRRQLLVGLGGLVGGGGIAAGTGAFTSVDADRQASVAVVDEDKAFLSIFPSYGQPNGTFADTTSGTTPGEQITFDINDRSGTAPGGVGVGLDSTYNFDDVFRVENGGTQPVFVDVATLVDTPILGTNDGDVTIKFTAKDSSGNRNVIDGSTAELKVPVGGQRPVGIRLLTDDESTYGSVNGPTDTDRTDGPITTITGDATNDSGNAVDPGTPSTIINP